MLHSPPLLAVSVAAEIADVDVRLTGTTTPLAQNLDFRASTQTCVEVPPGEQTLVFSSTGVELATTAFTFEEEERYTAFLVASGATRRAFVASDEEVASTGNNALRLVNATTTAGDVYVIPPADAVGASFLAGDKVQLFDPGVTTGTRRADFALTGLPVSRLATVVFTQESTPAGPTAVMVVPCPRLNGQEETRTYYDSSRCGQKKPLWCGHGDDGGDPLTRGGIHFTAKLRRLDGLPSERLQLLPRARVEPDIRCPPLGIDASLEAY